MTTLGTYRYLTPNELEQLTHLPWHAATRLPDQPIEQSVRAIAVQPVWRLDRDAVLLVWSRSRHAGESGWFLVWWHLPWPQRLEPALGRALRSFLNEALPDATPEAFEAAFADTLLPMHEDRAPL